ncbi:sensor histidine kinase [Geomicrobium sediminis]|uniref:histidine kinase n=1 Tax=Geomicrobium sediminis TaxID=1347788 RepID=A0ABS2P6C8_9BACL|nr:HAMP domain-containing sensor histidine kinase [Geomicrobium sediminis]MBM7630960.1 signal transduction histidine kinase [Geomicrobium sediminis]
MKGFRFRLWRRFTFQYSLVLFVTALLLMTFILIFGFYLETQERRTNFYEAGLDSLAFSVATDYAFEGELAISDNLQQEADARNGWFQIVSEDGNVLDSYPNGSGFSDSYSMQELTTLIDSRTIESHHVYTTLFEETDETYLLIYGEERITDELLGLLQAEGTTTEVLQRFNDHSAWGYVFDGDELIQQLQAPHSLRNPSMGEVLLHQAQPERVDAYVQIGEADGLTYVVYSPIPELPFLPLNEVGTTLTWIALSILALAILSFIVSILWFTRTFTKPINGAVDWLEQLEDGNFQEPKTFGKTKKGRWKRPYHLYQELYQSLSNLSNQLRVNKEKREALEASREAWIAGLSHDMKTPLASIQGYSIMLANEHYDWESHETQEIGKVLTERSNFMAKLIDDLSLTYRLESHAMTLQKENVDVTELLIKSIEAFQHDDRSIQLQIDPSVEKAYVDPKWFGRMIENLLDNALKHNEQETNIRVRAFMNGDDTFTVQVADHGQGMSQETLKRLFDRYYRGKSSQEHSVGSGLGMTITKELVQHHGGSIDVSSELNAGTTVSLVLPVGSSVEK